MCFLVESFIKHNWANTQMDMMFKKIYKGKMLQKKIFYKCCIKYSLLLYRQNKQTSSTLIVFQVYAPYLPLLPLSHVYSL